MSALVSTVKYSRHPAMALLVRLTAAALSFLLGIVTARSLGIETFGTMNVLLALVNIGVVFSLLGHENLATRTIANGLEQKASDVVSAYRHYASRQVWVAGVVIALILAGALLIGLGSIESSVSTAVFALLIPLIARTRLGQAMVRGMHNPALALVPDGILRPVLMIAGVFLVVALNRASIGWVGLMFLFAASVAVVLVCRFERGLLKEMFDLGETVSRKPRLVSFHLYVSSLLSVATTQLAVIIVGLAASAEEAGIYSAAEKIALAASLLSQSIYLAIASRLASLHAAGELEELRRTIRSYTRRVGTSTLILCVCIAWFCPDVLAIYGAEFSAGVDVLLVLLCSTLIAGLVGPIGHLLIMTHHEADHAKSMVFSLIFQLGLYAILAPAYGALGVAVGTLIATLIWNGLMMLAVRRRLAMSGFLAWA